MGFLLVKLGEGTRGKKEDKLEESYFGKAISIEVEPGELVYTGEA
ncbi:MAG: hypothetical protein QW265_00070 [Candidatus Bathyarchaeia archaeon]